MLFFKNKKLLIDKKHLTHGSMDITDHEFCGLKKYLEKKNHQATKSTLKLDR
jgi:hypothetical protein